MPLPPALLGSQTKSGTEMWDIFTK
jgi:hypothetical protein